jgi:plasmid segregation protein ParM
MNSAKIIAIDHENSLIKPAHGPAFAAGLADSHGFADETVEYRNRQYALSHCRLPYMRDKAQSEDYFILTLFALARELNGLEEDVVLAVGLPPARYKTGHAAFEAYFTSRSPILFKYNGCPLTVRIERVLCFPQAYAAAMTRAGELSGKARAFVVDIGGMTVDTLLLRNSKPDMAYTMSLEGGVNRLLNDDARALSSELGVRAEPDQMEAVLRGEESLLDETAVRLIRRTAERFAARLLRDLAEQDIDLRTSMRMFVGGGSLLLRQHIERSPLVKASIFVEEINANALGYELMAKAVLGR